MFIATKNNPYYPEVEYFEDIESARLQIAQWQDELQDDNGKYDTKLTLAKVIVSIPIKTPY